MIFLGRLQISKTKGVAVVFVLALQFLAVQVSAEPEGLWKLQYNLLAAYDAGEYERAIDESSKMVRLAEQKGKIEWTATGWYYKGLFYSILGEDEKAIEHLLKVLSLKDELRNDSVVLMACDNLGKLYKSRSQFQLAASYMYQALETDVGKKSHPLKSFVFNSLGNLQRELGALETSLDYHRRALAIRSQFKDTMKLGESYNNIGKTFLKLHHTDSALYYLLQAQVIFCQPEEKEKLAYVHQNLGDVYAYLGRAETALRMWKMALSVQSTEQKAYLYAKLSRLYFEENQVLNGSGYIDSLNEVMEFWDTPPLYLEADVHFLLRKQAESQGDYKMALIEMDRSQSITQSIFQDQSARSISEWETKLKTSEISSAFALNKSKLEASQLKYQLIRQQFIALAVFLLLILSFAIWAYLWGRREKKFKKQKESLFKELNHRVTNNLTSLSGLFRLQLMQVTDLTTKAALLDGNTRLDALNLVHSQLQPDQPKTLGLTMDAYLEPLIRNVVQVHDVVDDFELHLHLKPSFMPADQAVLVGLITNEVLTNACKYAKAAENATITVQWSHGRLYIADNGPGLPNDVDHQNSDSTGMMLIRELSDQLKANYSFSYQNGLAFELLYK